MNKTKSVQVLHIALELIVSVLLEAGTIPVFTFQTSRQRPWTWMDHCTVDPLSRKWSSNGAWTDDAAD